MSEPNDRTDAGSNDNDQSFDPYRFGAPDRPVPPEYAPPGYEKTGYQPPAPPPERTGEPVNPAAGYGPPPAGQAYGQPGPYPNQYPGQYPGQSPYGPPPGYGAPHGQPPYAAYGQPPASNGKATAGLILGIASIVLCWLTFLDLIPIILGFVFSTMGLSEAKQRRWPTGLARAGIWCTVAGTVCALAITVVAIVFVEKTDCSVSHPSGSFAARVCTSENR